MADEATVGGGGDYKTLALRIGLASHPSFAGAIHERLILEVLWEIPTARLSLPDILSSIERHFDGIRLTVHQTKHALAELEDQGWIEVEPRDRTGDPRFFMTLQGQEQWNDARRNGVALEREVREEFFARFPGPTGGNPNERWRSLLAMLDNLFAREALQIAELVLETGDLRRIAELDTDISYDDDAALGDLSAFLTDPTPQGAVFLRRLLHGALAFHLFRATPEADAKVVEHLKERRFYLDANVLYALVAQEGEAASCGNELMRATQELDIVLLVTTETLVEFQNSVANYKKMLTSRGITDASFARILLHPRLNELDDFRRGYYRKLIRDGSLEIDAYALRYETIEDLFPEWGIPPPRPLPTHPVKGPDGKLIEIEQLNEFEDSLTEYLDRHPRRKLPEDEAIRRALIHHDALHVAWVQKERARRNETAVPIRPSQVRTWFLTSDRHLERWDREYLDVHGPGKVPRCLNMGEWIETVTVFLPSMRESEALNSLVLRLVARQAPSIKGEDDIDIEDVQRIGRIAQTFNMSANDAARLVADRTLVEQIGEARTTDKRTAVVRDGVLRVREEQVGRLEGQLELFRSEAAKVPGLRGEVGDVERRAAGLEQDAAFGRQIRERAVRATLSFVAVGVTLALLHSQYPDVWGSAGTFRRALLAAGALSFTAVVPLWVLRFSRRAKAILFGVFTVAAVIVTALELWDRSQGVGASLPSVSQPVAPGRPSIAEEDSSEILPERPDSTGAVMD